MLLICKAQVMNFSCSLTNLSDKKNENKEVAVNDFLPASSAYDAIQYSMYEIIPSHLIS